VHGHYDVGDSDPTLTAWIHEMSNDYKKLPHYRRKQLKLLGYKSATLQDILLEANAKRICIHGKCNQLATFDGLCDSHLPPDHESKQQVAPSRDEELQAMNLEAIKAENIVRPKAESEVNFDIEDPPETFQEPTKLVTLHFKCELSEHDVLFPWRGRLDYSYMGNAAFRELIYDFRPFYLTFPQPQRRLIAKSLVYVIQHRGGKFFQNEGVDGPMHEQNNNDMVDKTLFALGQWQHAKDLRKEFKQLKEVRKSSENTLKREQEAENYNPDLDEGVVNMEETEPVNDEGCVLLENEITTDGEFKSSAVVTALAQESMSWETLYPALKAYIQQQGHPPQIRKENPRLYDWLMLQKQRQSQIESLFNSC